MNNGYIVRFIRSDDLPDEDYFYTNFSDALAHYEAYKDTSNEQYFAVQLLAVSNGDPIVKDTTLLAFSNEEREVILSEGCDEQMATCLRLKEIVPVLPTDSAKRAAIMARIKIEALSPMKYTVFFTLLEERVKS